MEVTIFVESSRDKSNYSCFVVEDLPVGLTGWGKTAKEAIEDLYSCEKEVRQMCKEESKEFPVLNYKITFDMGSFFNYYDYLSISGVAKRANINHSLMRQYVMGKYKPVPQRLEHINNVINKIALELQDAAIVPLPKF